MSVAEERLEELCTAAIKEIDDGENSRASALRDLAREIPDNDNIRTAVQAMIDGFQERIGELEEQIVAYENKDDEADKVKDAVDKVCDSVFRPVGKRTFTIPRNEEFDRAMIGLHDAIGRNI